MDRHSDAMDSQLYGSAMICSLLANINRDRKKRTNPYEPSDFMPRRSPKASAFDIPDGMDLYNQTVALFGAPETTE